METIYEFSKLFMDKLNLPKDAKYEFDRVQKIIMADPSLCKGYIKLMQKFLRGKREFKKVEDQLNAFAEKISVSNYTVHFVFLMNCSERLLKDYHRRGIPEDIFWDSIADLKYKLIECKNVKNIWGTFVAGWYNGFFKMNRFALGRFQFELTDFSGEEAYVCNGVTVKPHQRAIGMHIPSSGVPLTDEIRLDAYKKCYEFYKRKFRGKKYMPITCGSWLLYKKHYDFLPEHLNILKFMNDFDIVKSNESDDFGDAWRIFDSYAEKPVEEWPTDTSLRKAYAEWIKSGNKAGGGYGIFLFDGEKIINNKNC